jgi:hypothetical protein
MSRPPCTCVGSREVLSKPVVLSITPAKRTTAQHGSIFRDSISCGGNSLCGPKRARGTLHDVNLAFASRCCTRVPCAWAAAGLLVVCSTTRSRLYSAGRSLGFLRRGLLDGLPPGCEAPPSAVHRRGSSGPRALLGSPQHRHCTTHNVTRAGPEKPPANELVCVGFATDRKWPGRVMYCSRPYRHECVYDLLLFTAIGRSSTHLSRA